MPDIADTLAAIRIVPVLAIETVDDGLRLAEILQTEGLRAAEVTFRTAAAVEVIAAMVRDFPDLCVGAGTVLHPDDVQRSVDAGAVFAVAPGTNPEVVAAAQAAGLPFFPGVCTPSDVERALGLGCTTLKFFPAEAAGGTKMLQSLIGPYKHLGVRFMPTGGIGPGNVADYLGISQVVAVGGTWLAKPADLAEGRWDDIAERVREAVGLVGGR